jgi:hypothetical protein
LRPTYSQGKAFALAAALTDPIRLLCVQFSQDFAPDSTVTWRALSPRKCLMSSEKKRKAPEQQSAIAKLRRAGGLSSQSSSREASPPPKERQVKNALPAGDRTALTKSQRSRLRQPHEPRIKPTADPEESIPFAVLPYKQSWDGNRLYERISETKLRVELSEGTGCVCLGRFNLWVKHGTVSVLGATLEPGPRIWPISAPNCAALPTVEARSSDAEFELESESGIFELPSHQSDFFLPPEEIRDAQNDLPFFVLGLNFHFSPLISKQLPILELREEHLRSIRTKQGAASILVSGTRSAGTATLARCLMNQSLCSPSRTAPVIFVDLDPSQPALAPVGTIAVFLVFDPILGPQTASLRTGSLESACMHYVGLSEPIQQISSWHQACRHDMINRVSVLRKQYSQATLIVLAADSPNFDKVEQARDFFRTLNLTTVIVVEHNRYSVNDAVIQETADSLGVPIKVLPSLNENPHTGRQHQLMLQAYFGRQLHSTLGIDNLTMTYGGPRSQLLGITVPDGSIPPVHLEQVLPGLIAAVALVSAKTEDAIKQSVRFCGSSHLPILPALSSLLRDPADLSCCVLSMISKVDTESGELKMRIPPQERSIVQKMSAGAKLLLIVQRPNRDGKFTTRFGL